MQISLRNIGNSRGVIIPSAVLKQLHIKDAVEMNIESDTLVLRPVATSIRKGWFDHYRPDDDYEPLSEIRDLESEQEDWEW